jgi:hypothetical protein
MSRCVIVRWAGAAVVSALVAAGCGIATDDSPRDIEPRAVTPTTDTAAGGAASVADHIDLLPGISSTLVTVDGQEGRWPATDGELLSGPLTVYDYPDMVESTRSASSTVPTTGG